MTVTPSGAGGQVVNVDDGAHGAYLGRRTFGSLDGLRCLSIVAVLWHHSSDVRHPVVLDRGFLGVDMFFAISGYLIVTLLLRERDRHGRISLRDFYARRTLRIFPLYYALLGLLAAYFATRGSGRPEAGAFFAALPYYLAYLSNWITGHAAGLAVTWSLAAEEQFYLVWPLCEKWLRGARIWLVLLVVLLVNQVANFGGAYGLCGPWFAERRAELSILQTTFTPILLGVVLAHLLHERRSFGPVRAVLGGRWASPLLLAGVVALASVPSADLGGVQRLAIQVAMTALVGACVLREDHALALLLRLAPVRRIGVVSYGMYLLHSFLHGASERVLAGLHLHMPAGRFLALLLLTYVAAEASFWCFERPFLRLKSRFQRSGPAHGAT